MEIESFTLLETGTINVSFNDEWYLEQTPSLAELILATIDDVRLIETVNGADREYFRFEWKNHVFILQFECYGQSSWLEAEDELSQALIPDLFSAIKGHKA